MPSNPSASEAAISVNVKLAGPEWELQTTMSVPAEPVGLKELLPIFQSFADAVAGAMANGVEQSGRKVTCKKGCGACCRQLVPISETEARWIQQVVEGLPSDKQAEIRHRFAEVRRSLADAGLLEKLLHPESWGEGEGWKVAMSYFRLGIACPFLEEEVCSIHAQRPIKCREYLVTSPAEHCRQPSTESIKMVDLPFQIWTAMARLDNDSVAEKKIRWVPLALALGWADEHQQVPPSRSGREVLRDFFEMISGKGKNQVRPELDVPPASDKTALWDP